MDYAIHVYNANRMVIHSSYFETDVDKASALSRVYSLTGDLRREYNSASSRKERDVFKNQLADVERRLLKIITNEDN